jgi:hypothetical protein
MDRLSDVIIQTWCAFLPWNDHLHCRQLNRRLHRLTQKSTSWFTSLKATTFPWLQKRPLPQTVRILQQIKPHRVDLTQTRYAQDFIGFLQLNRLHTLNLSRTLVEDSSLTWIAFAPQLTHLNLTATLVTGTVFEYWPSQTLTHLDLTGCTNWQPQYLPCLQKFPLRYLSLAQIPRLRDTDLLHLPPTLTRLSVAQTAITRLPKLPHLMNLVLTQTRLSPDAFYTLAKLPLEYLSLNATPTTDAILSVLATCPLIRLNLEQTHIHGPSLANLNRGTLRYLNLSHNANLTGDGLMYLAGLQLDRLVLTDTPITHLNFIQRLHVKTLIASKCQYLTNISALASSTLDHIDLSETAITTLTLPSHLASLNLNACFNLQDGDFNLEKPLTINKLYLKHTSLTDMGLIHLTRWRIFELLVDDTQITHTGWQLYTNCKLPL